MASPPRHSPPPNPSLSLPRKRPPLSLPGQTSAPHKRRKHSIASASSHPLRQTSFPPSDDAAAAAAAAQAFSPGSLPSDYEDDDLASAVTSTANGPASLFPDAGSSAAGGSTSGRGRGRGRGRGSRGGRGRGAGRRAAETMSAVSGEAGGRSSREPGSAGGRGGAGEEEGSEEDDDGGGEDVLDGAKLGRERLEEEKERRAMFLSALVALGQDGGLAVKAEEVEREVRDRRERGGEEGGQALDRLSMEEEVQQRMGLRKKKVSEMAALNAQRYELWNRIHLKKEVVRRLTNQTLSQSVPGSVVTAISAYSKVFIGELVDRALEVQMEWTAARLKVERKQASREGAKTNGAHGPSKRGQSREDAIEIKREGSEDTLDNANGHHEDNSEDVTQSHWQGDVDESDLGPLLPDHLREALRRYKAERDGGVVGFTGLSLEGRENTAARNGGRRLFK